MGIQNGKITELNGCFFQPAMLHYQRLLIGSSHEIVSRLVSSSPEL